MPPPTLNLHGALYHFGFEVDFVEGLIDRAWEEPQRHFHTSEHLDDVIDRVVHGATRRGLSEDQTLRLILAAAFHDVVYDPRASDNEEKSCALLKEWFAQYAPAASAERSSDVDYICKVIMATKQHEAFDSESEVLLDADMAIVASPSTFAELMKWEEGIFREYQWIDYPSYANHRVRLLTAWASKYLLNRHNLLCLAEYVQTRRPRVGIYAGSFNPFHAGHLNIVQKAETMVDKVVISQGQNPAKPPPTSRVTEVLALRYRQTDVFTGLLTDHVRAHRESVDALLVRGLRNGDDLSYEVNQLRVFQDLMPRVKVMFIHGDREFEHISSTMVRQLDSLAPDLAKRYRG